MNFNTPIMFNDRPIMLAKLLLITAISMIPLIPSKVLIVLNAEKNSTLLVTASLLVMAIAAYIDVTLGLLITAILISMNISMNYSGQR